jgi:hypothetical protein
MHFQVFKEGGARVSGKMDGVWISDPNRKKKDNV